MDVISDKRKTSSARERARASRKELETKRQQQRELVEEHQIAYFAACDDIAAVHAKSTALEEQLEARESDDTAEARHRAQMEMGALVVETGQPVEDVAVLTSRCYWTPPRTMPARRGLHTASITRTRPPNHAQEASRLAPALTETSEVSGPADADQEVA